MLDFVRQAQGSMYVVPGSRASLVTRTCLGLLLQQLPLHISVPALLTLTVPCVHLFSRAHEVRGHSAFCTSQGQEEPVCPSTQG